MSEFGIKIKNYEAASIYEYQHRLRSNLDATDAMLTNSLFKDFLVANGLNIWKEESTRDIICIGFSYGTKNYSDTIKRLDKALAKVKDDEQKADYLNKMKEQVAANKADCKQISKQDLRTLFYTNGVDITYYTHNKKGEVIKEETLHYKMLYRTPGKAKKGTCMFIREELYEAAHNFLYMGIQLPEQNSPIVEMGAYSSLITSGIVGYCQIKPEQILILKDIKTYIRDKATIVGIDEDKHCYAETVDDYELCNEIFDGQALIDESIFPEWGDGYILLRHHMCKMAAFSSNIQLFFKDYFGEDYETAEVTDMWGNKHLAKDIKLITTNNAVKWLKFGVTFDYWAEWVRKNDCMFGVVKTSHPSKFGSVQRMSYQMINSLNIDTMKDVTSYSVKYIERLKSDDATFLQYLRDNSNFSNDYEVLAALAEHNSQFTRSSYFRERKSKIIQTYVLSFKSGKVLQNADNLTIVGSPYAMLLHSVGEDIYKDPTFKVEDDCIQAWTNRFNDDEYLAEFRNPFNSRNNLGYLHNVYHPYLGKYFNLGNLTIAVNMINTSFQPRNNGSDQDSDSIYTTNQLDIVKHARYCYANYPTVVNEVPPEKLSYNYTMEDFAKADNALAAAQLAIGESSNLAQICLTYTYNYDDKKYSDYVCILAVVAQIAIDNAKRKYDIVLEKEIPYIKSQMDIDKNGLPDFWMITKKDKRKARSDEERHKREKVNKAKIAENLNHELICPMNYLHDIKIREFRSSQSTIPIGDFLVAHEAPKNRRISKKVEDLIEAYSLKLFDNIDNQNEEQALVLRSDFDDLINDINKVYISRNYADLMSWLIRRAFKVSAQNRGNNTLSKTHKNRSILMKVLYDLNKDVFLSCFTGGNDTLGK